MNYSEFKTAMLYCGWRTKAREFRHKLLPDLYISKVRAYKCDKNYVLRVYMKSIYHSRKWLIRSSDGCTDLTYDQVIKEFGPPGWSDPFKRSIYAAVIRDAKI